MDANLEANALGQHAPLVKFYMNESPEKEAVPLEVAVVKSKISKAGSRRTRPEMSLDKVGVSPRGMTKNGIN